LISKLSQL